MKESTEVDKCDVGDLDGLERVAILGSFNAFLLFGGAGGPGP